MDAATPPPVAAAVSAFAAARGATASSGNFIRFAVPPNIEAANVHPGLLPPHPHVDPRNLAAGPKPASHVFPAAFAPSTATREGRRKLRAELPDGDAVRVLWKVQGGRSFSTVESKAAFTAVYPMLKQQNWANTYQLRGLLGY